MNYFPGSGKINCHSQIGIPYISETPFHEKFLAFHKQLTRHYETGGAKLYNPDAMALFCHHHAPGLFDDLLQLIRNDGKGKISKRREETQRQRVVAMLHQLSYFRNQVSW